MPTAWATSAWGDAALKGAKVAGQKLGRGVAWNGQQIGLGGRPIGRGQQSRQVPLSLAIRSALLLGRKSLAGRLKFKAKEMRPAQPGIYARQIRL
jgi:hypothetical protein